MKKITLLIIFFTMFLISCDDAFNTEPKEEGYYLSVRIVDVSTNDVRPLKKHLIGIYVNQNLSLSTFTDNNGWVTYTGGIKKADFIKLKISSKDLKNTVILEEFTPTNHPDLFVRKKSDLKTNIPPKGYHIWTTGLL